MILTELKKYLQSHHQATLRDLAHHFNVTPEAIEGMLEHWIRKGHVRRSANRCTKGCCETAATNLIFYEWVE
jgi:DNA-binding MarR family transcriptional regulator